jgi:hypothetical protein
MTRLAFAPVIPIPLLTALAVIAVLIVAYAFFMRARGAWARGLAFAVLLFARFRVRFWCARSMRRCPMWR